MQGRAHLLKEYTIATEALGRRPGFDPHEDTIVRVTVHSLRKRLQEVYQHEGAERSLRMIVPPGRYEPTFLRVTPPVHAEVRSSAAAVDVSDEPQEVPEVSKAPEFAPADAAAATGQRPAHRINRLVLVAALLSRDCAVWLGAMDPSASERVSGRAGDGAAGKAELDSCTAGRGTATLYGSLWPALGGRKLLSR